MPFLDQLRDLYDINWASMATRREGLEIATGLLAPDFEYQFAPEVADRTLRGVADISNFMMAVEEDFRDFRQRAQRVFGQGERIVVVGQTEARGRMSGLLVRTPFVHVWTLQHGAAVRVEEYSGTEQALAHANLDGATEQHLSFAATSA